MTSAASVDLCPDRRAHSSTRSWWGTISLRESYPNQPEARFAVAETALHARKFDLAVDVVEAAGFRPGRDRFDFWRR